MVINPTRSPPTITKSELSSKQAQLKFIILSSTNKEDKQHKTDVAEFKFEAPNNRSDVKNGIKAGRLTYFLSDELTLCPFT